MMLLRPKDVIAILWVFPFQLGLPEVMWYLGCSFLQCCVHSVTQGAWHTPRCVRTVWGAETGIAVSLSWYNYTSAACCRQSLEWPSCPCMSLSAPESPKTSSKSQVTEVSRDPVFGLVSGSLQNCAGTILSMLAIIHNSWLLIKSRHGPETVSVEVWVQPSRTRVLHGCSVSVGHHVLAICWLQCQHGLKHIQFSAFGCRSNAARCGVTVLWLE